MLVVGIDTGRNTGLAMWCTQENRIVFMESMAIDEAWERINLLSDDISFVFVEDARLRRWYGENSEAKKQGAGAVKAHAVIWEDYLKRKGIPYKLVAPSKTWKGVNRANIFNKMYPKIPTQRHNHHVRDAISLCYEPHKKYCKR